MVEIFGFISEHGLKYQDSSPSPQQRKKQSIMYSIFMECDPAYMQITAASTTGVAWKQEYQEAQIQALRYSTVGREPEDDMQLLQWVVDSSESHDGKLTVLVNQTPSQTGQAVQTGQAANTSTPSLTFSFVKQLIDEGETESCEISALVPALDQQESQEVFSCLLQGLFIMTRSNQRQLSQIESIVAPKSGRTVTQRSGAQEQAQKVLVEQIKELLSKNTDDTILGTITI